MELGCYKNKYCCMWCLSILDEMPNEGVCPQCSNKGIKKIHLEVVNPHKAIIIKISRKEILNNIRDGYMWFQSPKYYQRYSGRGQGAINDKNEGIDKSNSVNINSLRLMSFYSLQIDENEKYIIETPSKKLREFGDHFILINYKKLEQELKNYFEDRNISMEFFGFVKYSKNDNYSNLNPTFKDNNYSYQNEVRILLKSNDFLKLGEEEAYKTDKSTLNVSKYFSEPMPIDLLLNAKKLDDIF